MNPLGEKLFRPFRARMFWGESDPRALPWAITFHASSVMIADDFEFGVGRVFVKVSEVVGIPELANLLV
jgi:hypothetical protein